MFTQKQTDRWLADELSKIGTGGWGAKIAAKYLPTKYFTQEFTVSADLASIIDVIQSVVVDTKFFNDGESQIVYGLTKSGTMNLNPVVIKFIITAQAEKSHISLCGASKEGLINQNTSQRAVEEIKRMLENLTRSP